MFYPSYKAERLPNLKACEVEALNDKILARLLLRWKNAMDPTPSKSKLIN